MPVAPEVWPFGPWQRGAPPASFVVAMHEKRRHMSGSQRVVVVAKLAAMQGREKRGARVRNSDISRPREKYHHTHL